MENQRFLTEKKENIAIKKEKPIKKDNYHLIKNIEELDIWIKKLKRLEKLL